MMSKTASRGKRRALARVAAASWRHMRKRSGVAHRRQQAKIRHRGRRQGAHRRRQRQAQSVGGVEMVTQLAHRVNRRQSTRQHNIDGVAAAWGESLGAGARGGSRIAAATRTAA